MNNLMNKTLALVICAMAIVITSCSHDDSIDVLSKEEIASKIIGAWECIEATGDENVEPQRIEYHEDGTYTYYKKYDDIWFPSSDKVNNYTLDKNILELNWTNSADKQGNEKWVVMSIDDKSMKWVSMHDPKDTSKTTKSRTWKKIEVLTEEKIKSLIVGDWQFTTNKYYDIDEDKLVNTNVFQEESMIFQRRFYDDNTFIDLIITPDDEENGLEEKESIQPGTYTIEGNKIILTIKNEDTGLVVNFPLNVYDINEEMLRTIDYFKKDAFEDLINYNRIHIDTWEKLPDSTPWQNIR